MAHAGPLPEPVQDALHVGLVLRRHYAHALGVPLGQLGDHGVGVIDEPLVVHLLDHHRLAAAAYDRLGEVVEQVGLVGAEHVLPHGLLGLVHRQPGVRAAVLVHPPGVEALLVDGLLRLHQLGVAGAGDAHPLHDLDGGHGPPALGLDDGDGRDGLDHLPVQAVTEAGRLVLLQHAQRHPVVRGVGGHADHQAGAHVRVAEGGGQADDLPAGHGRGAHPADELGAPHRADLLEPVLLVEHLVEARAAHDPDLVAAHHLDIFHLGVDPEVGLAEDGLRAEGGRQQGQLAAPELHQRVLGGLGAAAAGDVRLGGVDGHRAVGDARGRVVGLLDEQPRVHELAELPLDELAVLGMGGAGEAPPVGQEAEAAPVLLHVHLVEELHHGQRVGELGYDVLGAAVAAQVVDHVLVARGHALGQADGAVAGGMRADGEEHVVPLHALVPRDIIHVGEPAHVPDVQVASDTGVGEDDHELLALVPVRLVDPLGVPAFLPLGLDVGGAGQHSFTLVRRW